MCEYGHFLAECLLDVGPCQGNGFGANGVSWSELRAWQKATGRDITEWAAETIVFASRAYALEVGKSDGKVTPAPWGGMRQNPQDVMEQIKNGMRALMAGRKK